MVATLFSLTVTWDYIVFQKFTKNVTLKVTFSLFKQQQKNHNLYDASGIFVQC